MGTDEVLLELLKLIGNALTILHLVNRNVQINEQMVGQLLQWARHIEMMGILLMEMDAVTRAQLNLSGSVQEALVLYQILAMINEVMALWSKFSQVTAMMQI